MNAQGSSPLLMVMLLLLTGGLVLQISDKLLTAGTARIGDEYLYMQAFSEAQSSLARWLAGSRTQTTLETGVGLAVSATTAPRWNRLPVLAKY